MFLRTQKSRLAIIQIGYVITLYILFLFLGKDFSYLFYIPFLRK